MRTLPPKTAYSKLPKTAHCYLPTTLIFHADRSYYLFWLLSAIHIRNKKGKGVLKWMTVILFVFIFFFKI